MKTRINRQIRDQVYSQFVRQVLDQVEIKVRVGRDQVWDQVRNQLDGETNDGR
jgi:predicted RNA-binding protein Jag